MFLFHDSCARPVVSCVGVSVAQARMRLTVVRSTIRPAVPIAKVQPAVEKAMISSVVLYLMSLNPQCRSLQVWWLLGDCEMLVMMADGPLGFLAKIGFGALYLICFVDCWSAEALYVLLFDWIVDLIVRQTLWTFDLHAFHQEGCATSRQVVKSCLSWARCRAFGLLRLPVMTESPQTSHTHN